MNGAHVAQRALAAYGAEKAFRASKLIGIYGAQRVCGWFI